MIKAVTSLADLLYKSKTQEPYKQLAILAVNRLFPNSASRIIDTYEKAIKYLDEYTSDMENCSSIVDGINFYCNQIVDTANSKWDSESASAEWNRLFVLKSRQCGKTNTLMKFDGELMRFNDESGMGSGNLYWRETQEYDRLSRYSRYSRQEQDGQVTETIVGLDYDVVERYGIYPPTGQRITVQRRIPHNIAYDIRLELEDEMRMEIEREMAHLSYWDNDGEPCRRINEDNPNNDR